MSSQPAPSVATTPAGAAADAVPAQGQAQSPAPVAPVHLDTQAAESAAATLAQRPSAPPGTAAATKPALPTSSGSDRYPGSQPVTVDNANLPNIGIPVATEVYSTTDSVPTVVNYYKQRYPDGQVMEVNGQQVIAVDRPSGAKVIAVGTTGSETRIAIVRPAS